MTQTNQFVQDQQEADETEINSLAVRDMVFIATLCGMKDCLKNEDFSETPSPIMPPDYAEG